LATASITGEHRLVDHAFAEHDLAIHAMRSPGRADDRLATRRSTGIDLLRSVVVIAHHSAVAGRRLASERALKSWSRAPNALPVEMKAMMMMTAS
jgi:hypothetical protein